MKHKFGLLRQIFCVCVCVCVSHQSSEPMSVKPLAIAKTGLGKGWSTGGSGWSRWWLLRVPWEGSSAHTRVRMTE